MKFLEKIADFLLPIAVKLNNQRHLAAVRDSFITAMPLVMAASVFVLLNSLAVNFVQTDIFSGIAKIVDRGTLGILSVLVSFTTAYNLSNNILVNKPGLKTSGFTGIHAGGLAVGIMFMMMPIISGATTVDGDLVEVVNVYTKTLMSSGGLIYSIVGALLSTELFAFFSGIEKLQIKMPDEVPPAISTSFKSLISELLVIVIFGVVIFTVDKVSGMDIPSIINIIIQKPLSGFVLSPYGLIFLQFISDTLWAFGIHGSPILAPIRRAPMLDALTQNMEAFTAGLPIPNIVTEPFLNMYGLIGGGGCILALVIAIFVISKRKEQKTIAKLGLVPSIFNITEPIMFGLPVVMNPLFMIPVMLIPSINLVIAYVITSLGWVAPAVVAPIWVTPPGIYAFLATGGDIGAAALSIALLAFDVLLYIPFVIVANRVPQTEV